jgi:hypothetical protein
LPAATNDAMNRGMVPYGKAVTYQCESGYAVGGGGATSFMGTCEANGEISFAYGQPKCELIECGNPPRLENARLDVPPDFVAKYRDTIRVTCDNGMTLNGVAGGTSTHTLTGADDTCFVAAAVGTCSAPTYPVGGVVSDSQSASVKLQGVSVRVTSLDGLTVVDQTTSGGGGIYWAYAPLGTWTFTISYDGYITTTKNITLTGPIYTGGIADMSMSKVLSAGERRVVVEWAAHSRDIDSHTYWSDNVAHVYWWTTSYYDYKSGIKVSLDRDDVNGVGPETTTFFGIGDCTVTSKCLVKFVIDNYTPYDGSLGSSQVHVKVYKGTGLEHEFIIPEEAGTANEWTVFTMDARLGHEAVYEGSRTLPPYFAGAGIDGDWTQTFDMQMWSRAPTGTFIRGFKPYPDTEFLHQLSYIQTETVSGSSSAPLCNNVDINFAALGWQGCPAGEWMDGLYREGSRWLRGEGVDQITMVSCCYPVELSPHEWGDCVETPVFQDGTNFQTCPEINGHRTAVVALHRGDTNDRLDAINKMKCCALPEMGLLPDQPTTSSGGRPF